MKILISESQLNYIKEQISPVDIGRAAYNTVKGWINKGKDKITPNTPLPFNEKNLATELKKQNILYPDVALAQSMLETGYFKSDIFLDNNNLFGMKHPSVRPTLSTGKNRGHANFKSWQDSVKDYKMWQTFNKLGNLSKNQYIAKLNRIYCIPPSCGSDNYAKKVQSLLGKSSTMLS